MFLSNESDQGPVFVFLYLARGHRQPEYHIIARQTFPPWTRIFPAGGERLVSSKGEEVFVYFEKGDMKPRLLSISQATGLRRALRATI